MKNYDLISKTIFIFALGLLMVSASGCVDYENKNTVGNPEAFNQTGSGGVNLLPSLDTNCGGQNCIQQ